MTNELTTGQREWVRNEWLGSLLSVHVNPRYLYASKSAIFCAHFADRYFASIIWMGEQHRRFEAGSTTEIIEGMDAYYTARCTYQEVENDAVLQEAPWP